METDTPAASRRMAATLQDPATYGRSPFHERTPPAGSIELCETHISWVALAGPFAYKVKKPVRYDFGQRLLANLRELQSCHAVIGEVRGIGLFCGAELVADRHSREPLEERKVQAVLADCIAHGVIIGATTCSMQGLNNTLCLSPALIATEQDIDHITAALDAALGRVFG